MENSQVSDTIRWRAFLRVGGKEKAEKLVRRIAKTLGAQLAILRLEAYWKDPSRWEAVFTTPMKARNQRDATFEALSIAGLICPRWSVRPPQNYKGDGWDFAGWSEGETAVAGVISLEFEIISYP